MFVINVVDIVLLVLGNYFDMISIINFECVGQIFSVIRVCLCDYVVVIFSFQFFWFFIVM